LSPLLVALVADYLARLPKSAVVKSDSPPPQSAARPPKPAGSRREDAHRRIAVIGMPSPLAKAGEIAASRATATRAAERDPNAALN